MAMAGGNLKRLNQFAGQGALNDLLAHLYVRGAIYCRSDLRRPWAFSVDRKPTGGFHTIARGRGWLEVEGEKQKIAVSRGDLIVLPHGHAHSLRDAPCNITYAVRGAHRAKPARRGHPAPHGDSWTHYRTSLRRISTRRPK
ncbi:MAG: hypothetical protein DMG30_24065 [Acidobacteria bacterium]|nr:MAG: hypothetical protein DMG30_24065 [Acidobacteriota bacterium]